MHDTVTERVEGFCAEQSLFERGDSVLVMLSGGADSVCLLLVLQSLSLRYELSLSAFHLNHMLRGETADRDEAFCKDLCERLHIPFFAVSRDVREIARERRLSLEEAGREVRYEEANRVADEGHMDKLALAHQQDDVAETFLFHLFRGSDMAGLSSIPAKRGRLVRPLLTTSRAEIEAYLAKRGESFCTDETNATMEYTRNRIRHHILSFAKTEINARSTEHIARAAERIADYREYFLHEAEKVCERAQQVENGIQISLQEFQDIPPILQKEVLYRLLLLVEGRARDITTEHVESMSRLLTAQSGKQVALPNGVIARRDFDELTIARTYGATDDTSGKDQEGHESTTPFACETDKEDDGCLVTIPGEYVIDDAGTTISLRLLRDIKKSEIPNNKYTKWFDYGKIKGMLRLRHKRQGDRMGLIAGSKSIKAVLMEHKLAKRERDSLLLLADDEQVVFIPLVRACDNYRVDDATDMVLEVSCHVDERRKS